MQRHTRDFVGSRVLLWLLLTEEVPRTFPAKKGVHGHIHCMTSCACDHCQCAQCLLGRPYQSKLVCPRLRGISCDCPVWKRAFSPSGAVGRREAKKLAMPLVGRGTKVQTIVFIKPVTVDFSPVFSGGRVNKKHMSDTVGEGMLSELGSFLPVAFSGGKPEFC